MDAVQGYDVFLSYNSADSAMVQDLTCRLIDVGIRPWLSAAQLPAGQEWQALTERALMTLPACAVLIGPHGLGRWQQVEMRVAIDRQVRSEGCFRVIPVLLPGADRNSLPPFLNAATWVEFRRSLDDEEALRKLTCSLSTALPEHSLLLSDSRHGSRPDAGLSNLPTPLTPFIGREAEVAEVQALLRRPSMRLLTLSGAGGTGKTRLALQVANALRADFHHGLVFVALATIQAPELVAPTIAQALDISACAGSSLRELLKAYLREKSLLLLVDNFEQVIDAAPLLGELLAAAPQLKVLATSRSALKLYGEHEYRVAPLGLPADETTPLALLEQSEAVRLFVDRAQAVDSSFRLDAASTLLVAAICRRLDGLPLAIELVAACVKLLTLPELLSRLDHRLDLPASGPRDLPPRQRTLRGMIDWSYNLLSPREQTMFARLAVFAGGCTLAAAQAVCLTGDDGPDCMLGDLAALIDKSLLRRELRSGQEPRFVMLETIREYAQELLAAHAEHITIRDRHAEYYCQLALEARRRVRESPVVEQNGHAVQGSPPGQRPGSLESRELYWLERIEVEQDNLRAAIEWLLAQNNLDHTAKLGEALRWFWQLRGYSVDERLWIEALLARSEGLPHTLRMQVLRRASALARLRSRFVQAQALANESVTIARQVRDVVGIVYGLTELARCARHRGDTDQAAALLSEALERCRSKPYRYAYVYVLAELAAVVREQGAYERARALLEESLRLRRRLRDTLGTAHTMVELARVLRDQQQFGQAASLLSQSLSLHRASGHRRGVAHVLHALAELACDQGDYARARVLLEECLAIRRELRYKLAVAYTHSALGRVSRKLRDPDQVLQCYMQSLGLFSELGEQTGVALCLDGLASGLADQGYAMAATQLFAAAEALRSELGVTLVGDELTEHERDLARVRAALGGKEFAAAWAQGYTLPPERAVATAVTTPLQVLHVAA